MSFSIYTYSNPYEIDKEPYWDYIKNCAHFCVSQTMVNGMVSVYDDFSFGKLSTVDNLVKSLYEFWVSSECIIKQYAIVDNIIKRITINDKQNAERIRNALGFNKKNIVDSIRILLELDMNISEMELSKMTQEQIYLLNIYNEVLGPEYSSTFSLPKNFSRDEINKAIEDALRLEKEDINIDNIDTDTVIIHGVHQFSPIILRVLEVISKYKKVILLFNYQKQYKNIYQTWIDVYSTFDIPIRSQFSNEFRPEPLMDNSYEGNVLADKLANLVEGRVLEGFSNNYEILEFDNLTEFAYYVAKIFEEACIEQEKDDKQMRSPLYYMKEQFYSANNNVNDILKVYFPEQFGERHFLAYPIGHFFVSITNMWDSESGGVKIEDMNDIRECLSVGIIKEKFPGELISIFNKTMSYYSRAKNIREIRKLLKKLKKGIKNLYKDNNDKNIIDKIYYFNVTVEEIDRLDMALNELDEIANLFYRDFEEEENNFREFYKKIKDFLQTRVLRSEDLEDEFRDVTLRVLDKLNEVDELEAKGSFICLKETMSVYLKQEPKKGQSANWIVRNFEQIDGDILKSRLQKKDTIYHFACLSDEDMNGSNNDKFPWPLDVNFFEIAQNLVEWKCQVYVKSMREYKNFKRYALIYGMQFNRVKFKLSYIKNSNDKENEMYYLLKILGVKKKVNISDINNSSLKCDSKIKIDKENNIKFNQFDISKYKICKYKFLLESLVEDGVKYKDQFLLLKYFEILLEDEVRIKLQEQMATENIIMDTLNDEYEKLKRRFEFAIELDKINIIINARNYLKNEVIKGSRIFPKISKEDLIYIKKREEFIYLKINSKDEANENILRDKLNNTSQEKVDSLLDNKKLKSIKYIKEYNEWCKYCSNREICLELYKIGDE